MIRRDPSIIDLARPEHTVRKFGDFVEGRYTGNRLAARNDMNKTLISALLVSFLSAIPVYALPQVGKPAPAFTLPGTVGKAVKLQDFAGKWLVLYFYPADYTGGCTIEARQFQNDLPKFQTMKAQVIGVSMDNLESHKGFCNHEGLTFPLLSDTTGKVGQAYDAPGGSRNTYLIDPKGVLRQVFVAVNPFGHSGEVLNALQKLQK